MGTVTGKFWFVGVALALLGLISTSHAQDDIAPPALLMAELQFASPVVQAQWAASDTLWIAEQSGRIVAWDVMANTQAVVWSGQGWIGGFIAHDAGFIVWRNPPYICADVCEGEIELADGTIIRHPARVQTADLHPDGTRLLTTASDGLARVVHLPDGAIRAEIEDMGVNGGAWNADGSLLVLWDRAGLASIYGAEDLSVPLRTITTAGWLVDARFLGDTLLTVGSGGSIATWRADDVLALLIRSRSVLAGGTFNADGTRVLVWGSLRRGVFEVYETARGTPIVQVPTDADIRGAAFDATETRIAVWDAADRAQVWLLPDPAACYISTMLPTVNQRTAPSTDAGIGGRLGPNEVRLAVATVQGADGFVWWQLVDETWVRDDVVTTTGVCATLPAP